MENNNAAAVAMAAVLGVGPYASMDSPEIRKELAVLRRQIRTGAADSKIILTIQRLTALRRRSATATAPKWATVKHAPHVAPRYRRLSARA